MLCDCITIIVSLLLTLFIIQISGDETTSQAVLQTQDHHCPPWFFYNAAIERCECFSSPSTDFHVICTEGGALLRYGSCMTYEEDNGTFIGRCQAFEIAGHNVSETHNGFITLPDDVSELNDYMCGPMNRKGLVCSECVEGYGPAFTFFGYSCSKCNSAWYGIVFYLLLEFVPITIFYFIILIFRIRLTSSPFPAFIMFSQFTVTAFGAGFSPHLFETNPEIYAFNVVITFYGIWNLDFFHYLIPPFCVAPNLKVIHIVFFGYISAFYPLLLIIITWVCIELYSRDVRLFVWIWKKFKKSRIKFVCKETKSTIIDVFNAFLLLSYSKVLAIFVQTLEPDFIHNMNGLPTKSVLLTDPSIEWMEVENVPYVTISLFLFLVLILPPIVILLLYNLKKFRSFLLTCLPSGYTKAALNTFVEKFYDSYRDGLEGGRDMRAFASLYFILRILLYFVTIAEEYLLYNALIVGGTAVVIALIKPYKKTYMNVTDTLLLTITSFNLVMFDLYLREPMGSKTSMFYTFIIAVLAALPMLVFLGYIAKKIVPFHRFVSKKKKPRIPHCQKFSICFCTKKDESRTEDNQQTRNGNTHASVEIDLPDRVVNPENYTGQ